MKRTAVIAAALVLAAISARADSFVASPQDYPTPAAYAQAYADANARRDVLKTKVFNPGAYQCGDQCRANLMTPIERRVFLDNGGNNEGASQAAPK